MNKSRHLFSEVATILPAYNQDKCLLKPCIYSRITVHVLCVLPGSAIHKASIKRVKCSKLTLEVVKLVLTVRGSHTLRIKDFQRKG